MTSTLTYCSGQICLIWYLTAVKNTLNVVLLDRNVVTFPKVTPKNENILYFCTDTRFYTIRLFRLQFDPYLLRWGWCYNFIHTFVPVSAYLLTPCFDVKTSDGVLNSNGISDLPLWVKTWKMVVLGNLEIVQLYKPWRISKPWNSRTILEWSYTVWCAKGTQRS